MPAKTRRSVAFLLPNLTGGGAERVNLALAKEFLRRDVQVTFWLCEARGELLSEVPAEVEIVDLKAPRVRSVLRPLARLWKQAPPDAVLASLWPLTSIAAAARRIAGPAARRSRLVVCEHSMQSMTRQAKGLIRRSIMRSTMAAGYRAADGIVGVSRGVADDVSSLAGLRNDAVRVIYNPAATGNASRGPYDDPWPAARGGRVLSVGKLKSVKDIPTLVRAFAELDRSDSVLCVLGEGEDRVRIEKTAADAGVSERVLLPGFVKDPSPWYAHADAFALTSKNEGFGNVIVEALEFGVPVVSTDCPSGPGEILENGRYGRLVPVGDVEAIAAGLNAAMSEGTDRDLLHNRAKEFTRVRAADAYFEILLGHLNQDSQKSPRVN